MNNQRRTGKPRPQDFRNCGLVTQVKPPPIGMRHSGLTPPRDQVYFCPECDQVIPLSPAYGSRALRPMLSYLFTRYMNHWNHHHVEKETNQ